MTDLRRSDLRFRDVRRVVQHRLIDFQWDPGSELKNEWIVASLEDASHRSNLIAWLESKRISPEADAFLFWAGDATLHTIVWRDLLSNPERFFAGRKFHVVSKDVDWALEYWSEGTARFGRPGGKKG